MSPVDNAPTKHDEGVLPAPVDPADPGEPPKGPEAISPAPADEPRGAEPHERAQPAVADDADGPGAERTGSRPRRGPALLWAALAVLLVVALGASLLAADAVADRNRERQDRQEVEEVAGRLATALSTYDYRDFEASKRRVLALSTGAFASDFERAVGALASLIDQTKATSEATVNDVFIGNLGDGKASAIVRLEIRASGVGGPRVSVDNYVDLSLVKVEGEWKVDGLHNLNLGVAGGGTAATAPGAPPPPSPTP